ncbi:MAG: hypothetical protein E7117_02325 [Bacteroidales bacterium]|nr:hypothetical protein [Bacteroidales bacterium]
MNKGDLIKEISEQTGVSKENVRCITTHLMRLIYKNTQNNSKISLRGFGTFQMTSIKRKRSYNISTHSIEVFPATKKLKFTPSQSLKNSVKQQEKRLETTDRGQPSGQAIRRSNKIIEGRLNIGKRRENTADYNQMEIEYDGEVSVDKYLGGLDHLIFPALKTPKLGTPILKYQNIDRGPITGITEPLLLQELRKLCNTNTELTIIENVAIPIKGWNKPYIPDFVLYQARNNLYIDIEIDEPYDINYRKPIHYIGSNDVNRDNYLISNGWVVIRYSEKQIFSQLEEVIKDLQSKICWLEDANFCSSSLSTENRWTYNEAENYAKENFREQYLGIDIMQHGDSIKESDHDELNTQVHQYEIEQSQENLCVHAKDSITNQIDYILSIKPNYVRVTLKDSRQVILDGDSFKVKSVDIESYVTGTCSYRNWYQPKFKNSEIAKVEPLSDLYTETYWESNKSEVSKGELRTILINATLEGSPLWIRYKYKRGKDPEAIEYENFASCLYLSNSEPNRERTPRYRPSLTKPFIDMGVFKFANRAMFINGYGINELFNISESGILEVRVINCTKCYDSIKVYENSLCELVLNPYRYPLDYQVKVDALIAQKANFYIDDLLYQKLNAHYETLKGNIELALKLYTSIDYNTEVRFNEESSWGESCIHDINSFINQTKNPMYSSSSYEFVPDIVLQHFMYVKDSLIEFGWDCNK